jgi:hypothetical protein
MDNKFEALTVTDMIDDFNIAIFSDFVDAVEKAYKTKPRTPGEV